MEDSFVKGLPERYKWNRGSKCVTQCWQGSIHSLASVNFCLGCVGLIQVGRIIAYNRSVEKKSTGEQVKEVKDGIVASAEGIKEDVKGVVAR